MDENNNHIFKVQENNNGTFGKAKKITVPRHISDGKSFDDLMEIVRLYMSEGCPDRGRVSEEEAQNYTDMIEEPIEENAIIIPHRSFFMDYMKKKAPMVVICSVCLFGIIAWTESMAYSDTTKFEQEIATLEQYIEDTRAEREGAYSTCKALCEADRMVYDGLVTEAKGKRDALLLGK